MVKLSDLTDATDYASHYWDTVLHYLYTLTTLTYGVILYIAQLLDLVNDTKPYIFEIKVKVFLLLNEINLL